MFSHCLHTSIEVEQVCPQLQELAPDVLYWILNMLVLRTIFDLWHFSSILFHCSLNLDALSCDINWLILNVALFIDVFSRLLIKDSYLRMFLIPWASLLLWQTSSWYITDFLRLCLLFSVQSVRVLLLLLFLCVHGISISSWLDHGWCIHMSRLLKFLCKCHLRPGILGKRCRK